MQENVEVARRGCAAVSDGNDDELREVWDERGDYYPVEKFPESRPCHGVDEIARFVREFRSAWGEVEFAVSEFTPIGDDRVLVRATIEARGRESGLGLGGDVFFCVWVRHGRVFRQEDHLTLAGARRALGV